MVLWKVTGRNLIGEVCTCGGLLKLTPSVRRRFFFQVKVCACRSHLSRQGQYILGKIVYVSGPSKLNVVSQISRFRLGANFAC